MVDFLHSEFGNLPNVRKALQKFFASEPPGDSQYGVIALGQSMTIVQNLTRNPSTALASLDEKAFHKMVSSSLRDSISTEMREFMRHLDYVRKLVATGSPIGVMLMQALPMEAERIANTNRNKTAMALGGLRDLVAQLAKGTERRTLLLISDGFQLSPGRDAWGLLHACFPNLPRISLRGLERMRSEFESVVKVSARSNIVINTIDSRRLYAPSWVDAAMSGPISSATPRAITGIDFLQTESGMDLAEFAAATGGTSFQNSNDLLAGIRRAVADGRDYYTLGYVPVNAPWTAGSASFRSR